MKNKTIKEIIKMTAPVMAGYMVLGMGFGILMIKNGFTLTHVLLMSIFVFAGSLQYAGCLMMAAHESYLMIGINSLLINARHLFYGLSMIDEYSKPSKYKPYLIFALTDETFSLVCDKDKTDHDNFLISLFDQSYWVTGSIIGAIIGNLIEFNTSGIDFSLTALFLVILTDQWINRKDHFPALTGLIASIICLIIFGPSNFLIPSMILIATALISKGKKEGEI